MEFISTNDPARQYRRGVALARVLTMIDASVVDPQWNELRRRLYELRDAVSAAYVCLAHPAAMQYIATELAREVTRA